MRNLGPKSRAWLAPLGIETVAQLRRADPYRVYARLKRAGLPVSLNLLYALIGAVEDRDWREVQREQRSGTEDDQHGYQEVRRQQGREY